MLAGTLGIFEAVLRTAADTLRETDPLDERVVELEMRVDSLEKQTTVAGERTLDGCSKKEDADTGRWPNLDAVVPQAPHRDRTPPQGGVPARRECPKPRAKRPPFLALASAY